MGIDHGLHIGPYFEVVGTLDFVQTKRCCAKKGCAAHGKTMPSADRFCRLCGEEILTVETVDSRKPHAHNLSETFGFDEDALWSPEHPGDILLPNQRIPGVRSFDRIRDRDPGAEDFGDLDVAAEIAAFLADPTYGPIAAALKGIAVLRYGAVSYAH